jgi:protein-L-isoaspartate(D-aspartate) O-methyltransferase
MHKEWQDDPAEAVYAERRVAMVDEVAQMAQEVSPSPGGGGPALSPAVLDAIGRVPRHRFVPEDERRYAYQNYPLSIGHGQTISQPYIVALMTDLLAVKPGDRVLEIGTGCGYQTAVLAEVGAEVYSIEIVESLAQQAAETFMALGYDQIHAQAGDGYHGWPEHAPFDGIIVTAGAPHVPQPLVEQLKPGGRMVIPLGDTWSGQELLLIRKDENGKTHQHNVLPVRFVPLTGGH